MLEGRLRGAWRKIEDRSCCIVLLILTLCMIVVLALRYYEPDAVWNRASAVKAASSLDSNFGVPIDVAGFYGDISVNAPSFSDGRFLQDGAVSAPYSWGEIASGEEDGEDSYYEIAFRAVGYGAAVKEELLDREIVFYNPGGPGGSGVDGVSGFSKMFLSAISGVEIDSDADFSKKIDGPEGVPELQRVASRYLFIGWDPRGIGRSANLVSEGVGESKIVVPPELNSSANALDLELLRKVICHQYECSNRDRLSFYGGSYGTRIVAAYAYLFPAKVGHLVMDGISPVKGKPDIVNSVVSFVHGHSSVVSSDVRVMAQDADSLSKALADIDKKLNSSKGRTVSRWLESSSYYYSDAEMMRQVQVLRDEVGAKECDAAKGFDAAGVMESFALDWHARLVACKLGVLAEVERSGEVSEDRKRFLSGLIKDDSEPNDVVGVGESVNDSDKGKFFGIGVSVEWNDISNRLALENGSILLIQDQFDLVTPEIELESAGENGMTVDPKAVKNYVFDGVAHGVVSLGPKAHVVRTNTGEDYKNFSEVLRAHFEVE